MTGKHAPLRDRFFAKVSESTTHFFRGTPCWEWAGCRHKQGYGQIRGDKTENGRVLKAHRVSYVLHYGETPDDKPIVNHLCERKWCSNPAHLEATDQSHNTFYSTPAERAKRAEEVRQWHEEHPDEF